MRRTLTRMRACRPDHTRHRLRANRRLSLKLSTCTAIRAGMWERRAVEYARREGIAVDFTTLPVETRWQQFTAYNSVGILLRICIHRARMLIQNPRLFIAKARMRFSPQAKDEAGRLST